MEHLLDPLLSAPAAVRVHLFAALAAMLLAPVALLRRSRDRWHRRAGYAWVAAMAVTALSSFWIGGFGVIGPFSPIHALSAYVLWGLWQGVALARRGERRAHGATMRGIAVWGLCVAGWLTFLPGRRLNHLLFGDQALAGFLLVTALGGSALAWTALRRRRAGAA